MSTKTYDYLFKLLLIGDSGKRAIQARSEIVVSFRSAIFSPILILSVIYRCRQDLHSLQIFRKQLQYHLHLDDR